MSPKNLSPKLYLLPAILSIWLVFSAFTAHWGDQFTFLLAMALLAFTTTLSLTKFFRFSGWLAAILSISIYTFTQIGLNGLNSSILLTTIIFALSILVSAWLSYLIANEATRVNRQLENNQKLIDELRLYDSETGLLRYQYVYRTLKTEIVRSQRYEKNLSVILLEIGNLDEIKAEYGPDGLDLIKRQVAELLSISLRAMDIPFGGEKIGAILPETDIEGAQIVVHRLITNAGRKARAALFIGVAQFPTDGVTENELMQSAEAALHVSLSTGQPYVAYAQVREVATSKATDVLD
jgi:diguanylate cyclase (GGDEF)-like protein